MTSIGGKADWKNGNRTPRQVGQSAVVIARDTFVLAALAVLPYPGIPRSRAATATNWSPCPPFEDKRSSTAAPLASRNGSQRNVSDEAGPPQERRRQMTRYANFAKMPIFGF
jgi:hypothetical protein